MWKLVVLMGLISGEPEGFPGTSYLEEDACKLAAAELSTELVKQGFAVDRELSEMSGGIVVDNGKYRAAFLCEKEPSIAI